MLAQMTCAGFGNEVIFLMTDATKITIFLHFIVVNEVGKLSADHAKGLSVQE